MEDAISISHLSFSYTTKKSQFNDFNLSIPKASIYGLLGPNGAGKSTLMRLILGLLNPNQGDIKIFGKSLHQNKNDTLSKVGSLIEHPSLYNHLTGQENLMISNKYKGNIDYEYIEQLLAWVGLIEAKSKKVKSYSLGMKQRLGIAIAMVCEPDILVLDEPINGLDPEGIKAIRNLLIEINEKYQTTIFISSHLLSEIENTCSHIAITNQGNILFDGTIQEFKYQKGNKGNAKLEVKDLKRVKDFLKSKSIETKILEKNWLEVPFRQKDDLTDILRLLLNNNFMLTQCIIDNSLEDKYLQIIESRP